jgi:hypothetical protein
MQFSLSLLNVKSVNLSQLPPSSSPLRVQVVILLVYSPPVTNPYETTIYIYNNRRKNQLTRTLSLIRTMILAQKQR